MSREKITNEYSTKGLDVILILAISIFSMVMIYGISLFYKNNTASIKSSKCACIIKPEKKPSYEYLKSITVEIRGFVDKNNSWMGTGTVVKIDDNYTYILTNAHVAGKDNKSKEIYVRNGEGLFPVDVIKYHAYLDLAILRYEGTLKDKTAVKGFALSKITEKVYLTGHHLGMLYIYGEGLVAGYDGLYTIIQMPVAPGNSGSAVINKDGKLVAVVFAGNLITYFQMDVTQGVCVNGYSAYLFLKNNNIL